MACFYSRNETLDAETGSYINRFWWYVLLEGDGKNAQAAYGQSDQYKIKTIFQVFNLKLLFEYSWISLSSYYFYCVTKLMEISSGKFSQINSTMQILRCDIFHDRAVLAYLHFVGLVSRGRDRFTSSTCRR